MRTSIIILLIVCIAVVAGAIVHLNRNRTMPSPARVVVSVSRPSTPEPSPAKAVPGAEAVRMAAPTPAEPAPTSGASAGAVNPAEPVDGLRVAVDGLASPQTGFADRQALLKQLKAAGQLDQAIADLKQRALEHPDDATIPTALGEAYLSKFPVSDYNESAILGMQVNQSFDAALKVDPANWEAQFFKADAMSYWPAEMNKEPEVIQRLSSLIDQQEGMPPQPQFARTYLLLGEQYQKSGQPDYAVQTWRMGLAKFPNDASLQGKVRN